MARARSPCPPNDITNATRSRIDSRPEATIDSPPEKLMPTIPTFPSVRNCAWPLAQRTASSITSVTCGVILKRCRSGAATVSTPYPVAARSSARPTRRDSLMPSRWTPGIITSVRLVWRAGRIEARRDVAAARRHPELSIARERTGPPRRDRGRGAREIGGANDEAKRVEIGKGQDGPGHQYSERDEDARSAL